MLRKFLNFNEKMSRKTIYKRYGFALSVSVVGLIIKATIHGISLNSVPVFFLVMTLSSVYGGRGPGILSAAVCSLINLYLFIPPVNTFYITSIEGTIQFLGFTVGAFVISSLTGSLYEEREKAKKATEKALDYIHQKESFVANVTHEIRTPINAVIGLTNIVNDVEGIPPEAKAYINKIQESSEILLSLVNDILDFSKLDFGKIQIETIDFKLSEKIHQSVSLVSQIARNKKLEISYRIDPDLPTFLKGDPSRISQVLLNLLSNAVKFTEEGRIQLIVQLQNQENEFLNVKFKVIDTGVGVAQEAQGKIFDAFVQEDISTTRKYGGTGLGLSICKRLVGLMGGEIGVVSEVGRGSTFWFSLPLEKGEKKIISDFSSKTLPKTSSDKKILVVEDNEVNLLVATKTLQKLGCHVDSAQDGSEALALVTKDHYDAILMDCHMPKMDGYETTQKIRELEAASDRHTPIIALTAYASKENQERCLQAGMDDYLSKPIRVDQLVTALNKWMKFQSPDLNTSKNSVNATEVVFTLTNGNPTLDTAQLLTLRDQLGDQTEIVDEVIETFLTYTPERIKELENVYEKGSFLGVEKIAHNLKSASATVGASNMAKLCGVLETLSGEKKLGGVDVTINAIRFEFLMVKEELSEFKRNRITSSTPVDELN